jgi:hypothetical protein
MLRLRLGVLGKGQPFRTPLTRREGIVERPLHRVSNPAVGVRVGGKRRLVCAWTWVEVERES